MSLCSFCGKHIAMDSALAVLINATSRTTLKQNHDQRSQKSGPAAVTIKPARVGAFSTFREEESPIVSISRAPGQWHNTHGRFGVSFCLVHNLVGSAEVSHCALRDRLLDASRRSHQPSQLVDQVTEHRDFRFSQASLWVLSHLLSDLLLSNCAHNSPAR